MRTLKYFMLQLIILFVVYSTIFLSTSAGETVRTIPADPSSYDVPDEKKKIWESIRKYVSDEYNVCIEHCGNESNCMSRCQEVYKSRLDREYMKLMSK